MLRRWLVALILTFAVAIPAKAEVPHLIKKIQKANYTAWKKNGMDGCKYAVAESIRVANKYLLRYRAPKYFATKEKDGWGHVFLVVEYEGKDWIIDHIFIPYLNDRKVQKFKIEAILEPVDDFEALTLDQVEKITQRSLYEFYEDATDDDIFYWQNPERAAKKRALLLDSIEDQLDWLRRFIKAGEGVIKGWDSSQTKYQESLEKYRKLPKDQLPDSVFEDFDPRDHLQKKEVGGKVKEELKKLTN